MAKLYSNENFPFNTVKALRKLGHDVLTTLESGRAGQAIQDEDVLAYAAATGRILLTHNRKHFVRLHKENPKHAGVIVCTADSNFEALAERIHTVLELQPEMSGQLKTVTRPQQ